MAAAKKKAGQSARTLAQRKADNKGVKDGTVRRGAAGKADRKYNASTGRWEIVRVGSTAKSQPTKQQVSKAKARSAESSRMSAMAKDKAASSRNVPAKKKTTSGKVNWSNVSALMNDPYGYVTKGKGRTR